MKEKTENHLPTQQKNHRRHIQQERIEAIKSPGFATIIAQENGASPKGDRSHHIPLFWDQPHLLVIFPGS